MNLRLFLFYFCLIPVSMLFGQDTLLLHYAKTITKDELSTHVYKLASGEFEGRYTGSKGLIKAEKYITEEFIGYGLEMPIFYGKPSYTQDFTLDNCRWKDQRLLVDGNEFKVGKDFLFLNDPVDIEGEFPVVFAGFGIEDSVYSDFNDIDVEGKIMLVFSGEPVDKEGRSVISGKKELTKKGYYFSKVAIAIEKGAKGAIIIAKKKANFRKYIKSRSYYDPKPNLVFHSANEESSMQKQAFAAFMSTKTASRLVNEKPARLKVALHEMEIELRTTAGRFTGNILIHASSDCIPLKTGNVIGIIEGTELKHEAVVVIAHYDHLGKADGKIYYGADDNASGTAAVIEIAEAFSIAASEGIRPKRTVIFIAASAEELGLYGSRYYSENPIISLDSTYACVNIDMIGRASTRLKESPEYISGYAYVSKEILEVSQRGNFVSAPDLEDRMEYKVSIRGGSDHYYFAKYGIPSLFYFTGFHNDYHKTTDTPDKILYDRMEKIVRAIFSTTWELANREGKL